MAAVEQERDVDVTADRDQEGPEPGNHEVAKMAAEKLTDRIEGKLARAYGDPRAKRQDPGPENAVGTADDATYDPVARAVKRQQQAEARTASYSAEEFRREQTDRLDREIVRSQMNDVRNELAQAYARIETFSYQHGELRRTLRETQEQHEETRQQLKVMGERLLDRDESLAAVRKNYAALVATHTRAKARNRRRR